jgi:capsular exopolysaccharide synthesis family protein
MNKQQKIFVNTSFDLDIVKVILRRNWYWCILICGLLFGAAFTYLRYTKPVFESSILIQLNDENQGRDVLNFNNLREENSIAKEIELLRSQLLFKEAVKDLPLRVSNFAKGDFLTDNRYKQGTFRIQPLLLKDSILSHTPIYLTSKNKKVQLNFTKQGKSYHFEVAPNTVLKTSFFDVKLIISNFDQFRKDAKTNKLFFKFNDSRQLTNTLISKLKVRAVDQNARTVEISYRSYSAPLAKDIVTSVADNFFKFDEDRKKQSAKNVLNFITFQLDSLKLELKKSKDSIIMFQRRENIPSPDQYGQSLSKKMNHLRNEERNALEDLRVLNIIDSKLKNAPNSLDVYRVIPSIIGQSYGSSLNSEIKELYELIESKESLLYQVTPENTDVKVLERKIKMRKENIGKVIFSLQDGLKNKVKLSQIQISKVEEDYFQLPEKQMELSRLQNIQDLNKKYFTLLTEKKVMYSISNAGYTSKNKILNSAMLPVSPISPKKTMVYSAFLFLSITLSFAFLLLRYITYNKVSQIEDLQNLIPSNVGMLGAIPMNKPQMVHSVLLVHTHPKSLISESFRILRTNLSFVKKDLKTIAVTSTVSNEGKTFIALNTAGIMAMSGKKVLIVDLDMRKPKMHLGFDGENKSGMSHLLAQQCELEDVIHHSSQNGLDFISAGPIPPNPSELMLSDHFENVLEAAKQHYDVVIFDTPPVGIVSDGVQLLSKVDVPIYVFRANYSKRHYVDKLRSISEIKEIKNISVALNGVTQSKNSYGYGDTSYYTE